MLKLFMSKFDKFLRSISPKRIGGLLVLFACFIGAFLIIFVPTLIGQPIGANPGNNPGNVAGGEEGSVTSDPRYVSSVHILQPVVRLQVGGSSTGRIFSEQAEKAIESITICTPSAVKVTKDPFTIHALDKDVVVYIDIIFRRSPSVFHSLRTVQVVISM